MSEIGGASLHQERVLPLFKEFQPTKAKLTLLSAQLHWFIELLLLCVCLEGLVLSNWRQLDILLSSLHQLGGRVLFVLKQTIKLQIKFKSWTLEIAVMLSNITWELGFHPFLDSFKRNVMASIFELLSGRRIFNLPHLSYLHLHLGFDQSSTTCLDWVTWAP